MAPFNQYFAAQAIAGFNDNSLFGIHWRLHAADGLQFLGQIYADDLSFKDPIMLDFDTKYKLAGEIGLRYASGKGWLSDLAADYTAVLPYMYTHVPLLGTYRRLALVNS